MERRQLLFTLMLWSLGIAAIAGVLAMLTATYGVAGRIVGTALLTTVAAAVLWKLSPTLDESASTPGGLLGVALTLLCYLLVLPAIWDFGPEAELLLTALGTAICGGATLASLRGLRLPSTQLTAATGLAAGGLVWVLWMISTWLVDGQTQDEWWQTTLAVGFYSTLAALAWMDFQNSAASLWRAAGAACAVLACGLLLHQIWSSGVHHLKPVTVLTSVTAVVVYANLALRVPLEAHQMWILTCTLVGAVITALGVDLMTVGELDGDSFVTRIAGAAAIATGCGTLALLVLARLNREPGELPTLATLDRVTFLCPRCRQKQTVPFGEAICPRCDTHVHITLSSSAQQPASN